AVINWFRDLNNGAWNDFPTDQEVVGIVELSSVPAGAWLASEGPHTVSLAAGVINDLQGTPLTAYSGTFTLDYTPPQVVSSSIQEGALLPDGDLTYTIKFSEPLQTSLVDPFDFGLFGQFRGESYFPSSLSFDPTGTELTVNYENLLDDEYTLTLFSNPFSFVDQVGLTLDGEPVAWPIPTNLSGNGIEGGDFFVNFATDFDTRALPTPLQPVEPLGGLVYQTPDVPTAKGTIVFADDTDAFTIDLDAGQTASIVIGVPGGNLQPTVSFSGPDSTVLGSATAAAVGEDVILQTIAISDPGIYRIVVGSADGLGLYSVNLILNAAVEEEAHSGPSNDSPADAQSLGAAFIDLNAGADRAAVLGRLEPFKLVGTIYQADFETGEQGFTVDNAAPDPFYREGLWHLSTGRGDQPGHSASNSFYYGQFEGPDGGGSYSLGQVNPTTGSITSPPIALPTDTAVVANFSYVLQTRVFPTDVDFASLEINDGSGWAELQRYDRVAESSEWTTAELVNLSRYAGQTIQLRWSFDTRRGPVGRAPEGWYVDDVLVSEAVLNDYYSFELQASDNATIALQSLSDANVDLTLIGPDGTTRLAKGTENLARNVDEIINNFIATTSGTYYLKVTGDPGAEYNLVVTRGVDFDTERNDDQAQAQDITGTSGALGAIVASGVDLGIGFEGIDFLGSNCGCLPPDTNAAVGGNWVVETVNTQIRVFDKTTGTVLLDESLSSFFGAPSAGDPYVVFDDIVDRWYVTAFDGGASGLFLAVSSGADPLGGFLPTYHLTDVGGFPDYPKMGFNHDAIFISYNDFGGGGAAATIASIDKAAALSGTLTYYVSHPEFQFRAMAPAQMHGDSTGCVEWFVSTDGTDAGGDTMRV
ncbi:MAG: PPC domain-containing protein, partial [Gammaproteobacteria bacterium]|nr:PPC domain-containing protein [Gammaproteobacteria bacterium]